MRPNQNFSALAVAGMLALTAPAVHAQISGAGAPVDPIEHLVQIEETLRGDFGDLRSLVGSGQSTDPIVARMRGHVDAWEIAAGENSGAACAVHARLVRYIDYIEGLARRADLRARDVEGLHEHTLETLSDWHIATAVKRARSAGVAQAPLKRAAQLLGERAAQASGTPLEAVLRERFARRLNALISRAQQAVHLVEETRVELLDIRLSLAIERLREALRDRGGSRELFELVVALWEDRARAALGQDFPVCGG